MAALEAPHGTRVGLIGVGRMGLPICANLVGAGCEVSAWDQQARRGKVVTACGARWAATADQAVAETEVLITVLPGTQELQDLMLGTRGVLAALPLTATWIDMTSSSPDVGRVLAEAARARGIGMLEALMCGGVPAAGAGTLQLLIGGDAALLKRHRVLLEVLGDPDRITHVGGPGAGYTAKLLVNLLWFGQAIATAEALLVGSRCGIDLDILRRVLADSAAASGFICRDLDALLDGDYLASFGLDRCCEELAAVTALAREQGVACDLSALVELIYRRALARYGPADGELLPIAMLEEEAGIRLRTEPKVGPG